METPTTSWGELNNSYLSLIDSFPRILKLKIIRLKPFYLRLSQLLARGVRCTKAGALGRLADAPLTPTTLISTITTVLYYTAFQNLKLCPKKVQSLYFGLGT